MRRLPVLLFLIVLIWFSGCKSNKNTQQTMKEEDLSVGFEQVEEMKEIYYRFPSPDEMLTFIDKKKLEFNDDVLLPVDNSVRYLDSKSQALNLGVYIADLAYITLFQRQKEALTYFQVIYGLSDKLRISSAFKPSMLKKFEENIKNVDSLKALTDVAMNDIVNYLIENDKEKTFAIISIGGYIESLYLAFNMAGGYNENNPIIQRISDQKLVLENLINYALVYAGDPNVNEAIKSLHSIRAVYNQLQVASEETTVTKDKTGKLIISGGQKITITEDQYNKLKDTTLNIRKAITENLEK